MAALRSGLLRQIFMPRITNELKPPLAVIFQNQRAFGVHHINGNRSEKMVGRYFQGKLIEEEVDDPTVYPHVLFHCHGYDEGVLEAYVLFIKASAKALGIEITKSFAMPSDSEVISTVEGTGIHKRRYSHTLKTFKRIVQAVDLNATNSDIYIDHLKENLPSGTKLKIELKEWQRFVEPDHPSFRSIV